MAVVLSRPGFVQVHPFAHVGMCEHTYTCVHVQEKAREREGETVAS